MSISDRLQVLETGGFDPNRIRMLVYGESGVGKTVFSASWPDVLFLDAEDGMASVRNPVTRIEIDEWGDVFDVFEWLATAEHNFKTVVLDSLNELQKLALRYTVRAFPTIHRSYDSLPSQSDYGKMLDDFDKFVRAFKSLPMNVVYIAQVQSRQFDTDLVMPQLVGKNSARDVCRMMDVVGYLYKVPGDESQQLRAMAFDAVDFVTKDRAGFLPAVVENPTYDTLYKYWSRKKR